MKLLLILLLLSGKAFSQSTFVNDTLTYNNKNYVVGDTVHLWYGSANNKSFAFAYSGNGMTGISLLPATYSKADVVIDKIIKRSNKYWIKGKNVGGLNFGMKIFIDLEGAVDNKEIKE